MTGGLTLLLGGLNKQTLVVGPFLVVCAGFAVARQSDWIRLSVEIPCLIISFGVIMLAVTLAGYSLPDVIRRD